MDKIVLKSFPPPPADDDDEDEEEEEEGSVFDEAYEDLEEAFIRLPGDRDSDDILLLPSYQQYIDTIDTIIFGDRVDRVDRVSLPHHHGNSHEDPVFMASTPNANPSEWCLGRVWGWGGVLFY